MIDLKSETVVSLTEATKHFPRLRDAKRLHVATTYRWTQNGCRGVKLESCQVGGTRCTSLEAIQRFVDRLTAAAGVGIEPGALVPSAKRRWRAAEAEATREGL